MNSALMSNTPTTSPVKRVGAGGSIPSMKSDSLTPAIRQTIFTLQECGFSKQNPIPHNELLRWRGVSAKRALVLVAEGWALPAEQDGLPGLQAHAAKILRKQLGIHDRQALYSAVTSGALKPDGTYQGRKTRGLGRTTLRVIFTWLGGLDHPRAHSWPAISELNALRRFVAILPKNERHSGLRALRESKDLDDQSAASVLARLYF